METTGLEFQFWPEFSICGAYAYTQRICSGFSKFYRFIFDSRVDSVGTFDTVLLYSFVIIFLAFLVVSVVAIFEKDQKSLQQIKRKVKNSTAVIASLAATLWAIRDTKFKSISYEGYRRIKANKASLLAFQDPPPVSEPELSDELLNQVKDALPRKKSGKGVRALKRELSPAQTKTSTFPYLKRARFAQQNKTNSLSSVITKKLKTLRPASSATSLHSKQGESTTPRSLSLSTSSRNASATKVAKRVHIGDSVK